jgi:hypothetical protein
VEERDSVVDVVGTEAVPQETGTQAEADVVREVLEEDVDLEDLPRIEYEKPNVVTLAEAKQRLKEAKSAEGRLKHAKPFPLPELGIELMVSPAIGLDIYTKVFGDEDAIFKGKIDRDMAEENVDRAFIKMFVQRCVVKPEVDDEFLTDLMESYPLLFVALMAFCMEMSTGGVSSRIESRLGVLDTEAQEAFFDATAGSMS